MAAQLSAGVTQIFSTGNAFAALKADGSVVTWGSFGGSSSAVSVQLSSAVTQIFTTDNAFAALRSDGSVVTWGDSSYGGDSSAVAAQLSAGVTQVFSTDTAFAALKANGSVVTWGDFSNGGSSSVVAAQLTSGVTQIFSTVKAFAALKANGSVVTWGPSLFGGDSSAVAAQLSSGVTQIFSTNSSFAALKANGSVVTWGDPNTGGDSSAVAAQLSSGVTQIFSTSSSFAALKANGSVVTWGDSSNGGDSSALAAQLSSGVIQIFSTVSAFAALKADGSVVTWGGSGGDSSAVAAQLSSGVVAFANPFTDDRLIPTTTSASISAINDNFGLIKGLVADGAATDDTTPTISGTLSAALTTGEILRIFNGATLLGTASVNNIAKTWTFTALLPATESTIYSITARVVDAAGNLGPATAARTFTLDTTAPLTTAAITGVADNVGLLLGQVANGAATDDTTPTITGTLSAALAAGETLRIFNGATLLGSATVDNIAKTWTFTPSLPATAGTSYSIKARVADAAGNLGPASAARTFTLDTTAPLTTAAITGVLDNVGLLLGQVADGAATDDTTPTISGTLSAALATGETLRLFNFASLLGSNPATLLGTATVDNIAKTWTFTPTLPVTAGNTYSITARVVDAAGNLGPASAARTFTLDTTAPLTNATITGVADNVGLIQGLVANGAATDDTSPAISGTLSAALAAGETLRLFNGATLLGTATVDNNAKTWTFTASLPPTAGTSYSITARVADAAGNLGPASAARTFTLDTTAPLTTAAITGVADNVGLIQGLVADGAATDDTTPTISGTLSAALATGETLRLFNGATLLGTATVDNNAKTWTFTPSLPSTAGTNYSITARVADAAGNLGAASAARTFTLSDNTAPLTTAAITGVADNVGLIKGDVAGAGLTDDVTPTITGTLSAGLARDETLRLFNGTTLLGTATVNNTTRTWSFTPLLSGTSYSITARVADAAGNLGPASAARTFTLDTTAPSVVSFTPLDGTIGVDPAVNIAINFSEAIQRGTGVIELRSGSAAGPIIESFNAATSPQLTLSGTGLTIIPTNLLGSNTTYVLTVPAGALLDQAGNPFAGTSSYDFQTANVVFGSPSNDTLSFTNTIDRLTGLAGSDTFRLAALSDALLPTNPTTPIDRITDFVTGVDIIDAPVNRRPNLTQPFALPASPVDRGSVTELSAAALGFLLTPTLFPGFGDKTAPLNGGVSSFTFNDPAKGIRTFLAINDGVSGFSAATDSILEITGYTGNLSSLQVF